MGRPRRIHIPNSFVHVTQKCHNAAMLLFRDVDKALYLSILKREAEKLGYQVISFCIQDNHIHIILLTPAEIEEHTLSEFMHRVNTIFGHQFNQKYGRVGTFWAARYHASGWLSIRRLLLLEVLLWYVEGNTWRRMTNQVAPESWPWCGAYYLFNGIAAPVDLKLGEYVAKIYRARGRADPVEEFRQLLSEERPDWRKRAVRLPLLRLDKTENKVVRREQRDMAVRMQGERVRSWKREVERYSLALQPILSCA